jgi:glycosyltransferase involved in cell wall biosynthesis
MNVFIIIASYNEQASTVLTIAKLFTHGFYNIVLVDDGSLEPLTIKSLSQKVLLIKHPINLGQGAALQTGVEVAKKHGADIVVHFDADGQHEASDIAPLIQPLLENRADVVLGSRFMEGAKSNISFGRKLFLQIARIVNFFFTGLWLSDAHNGLRALNKAALQKIVLTENRMAHASEILSLIKKHQLRWCEVPVNILYTNYSKQKGQKPVNAIHIFFDLLLKKLKS